ncbi:MAG TPA: serine protease [Kofleriaceae bacterium]
MLNARSLTGIIIALSGCATEPEIDYGDLLDVPGGGKTDAYGSDVRVDLYKTNDSVKQGARSIANVVNANQIVDAGDGTVLIAPSVAGNDTLGNVLAAMGKPLCIGEKYREQPSRGRGTAFLVAPDVVATAGHVAWNSSCAKLRFVFDYGYYEDPGSELDVVNRQPAANVYACKQAQVDPSGRDLAIIQLDRPVTGRFAFPLADGDMPEVGETVAMIGHPTGLPAKFAPPARVIHKELPARFPGEVYVTDSSEGFFTNLGAYQGNSGSPVFAGSGVAGVLVQGDLDWVYDESRGCYVTHVCAEDGSDCSGEYVLRAAHVSAMLR